MFGQPKPPKIPGETKSRNTIIYAVVVALLAVVALISGRLHATYRPPAGAQSGAPFQVHVIDVGQGDSILVLADGHAMLIDGGEPSAASAVQAYLKAQGVTKLDYVAATHPHADHIGGLPEIIRAYPPKNIIEPVCPEALLPVTSIYERFLDAAEASGARFRTMQAGDRFKVGGARVTVVGPVSADAENLNDTSLVLRVQYGDCTCLFTGDMGSAEETAVLSRKFELQSDFLKVAHHGSDSGSGEALLAAVQPEYAVISCAADNDYGHPHKAALDRIRAHTDKIYTTAERGDIVFSYDPAAGKRSISTAKKGN